MKDIIADLRAFVREDRLAHAMLIMAACYLMAAIVGLINI